MTKTSAERSKVIGLTGGIASGKSTAAKHLASLGAHVIDADLLGHRAYEPGSEGHAQVVAAFGAEVVAEDGTINRRVLGGKVFGSPDALARLTGIVWPQIRRLAEAEIAAVHAASTSPLIALEAAVLFEAGWEDIADEIWVVVTATDKAVERAMARDNVDEEAVRARIAAQHTNEQRSERAHHVFDNNGEPDALQSALDQHYSRVARVN
jgi:phosphopantetheine adenylyltransferase/dephospho-CoA kinase